MVTDNLRRSPGQRAARPGVGGTGEPTRVPHLGAVSPQQLIQLTHWVAWLSLSRDSMFIHSGDKDDNTVQVAGTLEAMDISAEQACGHRVLSW